MNAHSKLIFVSKNKYKFKKLQFMLLILCLIFCIYVLLNIYTYKIFLNSFKEDFKSKEFASANSLLLTKQKLNPIKCFCYKKDISIFFNDEISNLESSLENNEISSIEVINTISEIKHYDFIDCDYNNLLNLTSNGCFSKALNLYNESKYSEAYYIFAAVPYYSNDYDSSQNYMNSCKENLKNEIIDEVDILCKNNYYTKALDALYEVKDIIGTDECIISKTSEIETLRSDFIAMQKSDPKSSIQANATLVNDINAKTINSLSLNSDSNFLVHVNISDQKTYVYSGTINNWSLIKTMICSTGTDNEVTPEGSFTIKEKGPWFFSEKYKEGGKFWVQFEGNYLFHSVPYDKSRKKVLDYTLGRPASHGCIRLSEADAKWFYDNIPSGSKVIINKEQ